MPVKFMGNMMIKPNLYRSGESSFVTVRDLSHSCNHINTYNKFIWDSDFHYKFTLNNTLLLYFKGCIDTFND